MRASRILAARPERAFVALAQLCEERKDEELLHASPSRSSFTLPRLSSVPKAAQTPYTIGSNPMRPSGAPEPDRLSPPEVHQIPSALSPRPTPSMPPEHMAPKRAKWTSPPPPEAPEEDHSAFEDRLDHGLSLATAATDAREIDHETASSSANSEILTDDDDRRSVADSDDVASIRSYTEGTYLQRHASYSAQASPQFPAYVVDPSTSRGGPRPSGSPYEGGVDQRLLSKLRGRPSVKPMQYVSETAESPRSQLRARQDTGFIPPPRMDTGTPRRSMSGPARALQTNRYSLSALPAVVTPLSVYPSRAHAVNQQVQHRSNVFYETSSPIRDRMVRALSSHYAMPIARLPAYGRLDGLPQGEQMTPQFDNTSPQHYRLSAESPVGPTPPLSTTPSQVYIPQSRTSSHSHSHSQSTIIAPPSPSSKAHHLSSALDRQRPSSSRTPSGSTDRCAYPSMPSSNIPPPPSEFRCSSSLASVSSTSASPAMSYSSSRYAASVSPVSTSPPSPSQSETASPSPDSASPVTAKPAQPVQPNKDSSPVREQPRIAVVDLNVNEDPLAVGTGALSLGP